MRKVLLAAVCVAWLAGAREITATSWMAGSKAGTYREVSSVNGNGETITGIENDFVFNRMGSKVEMRSKAEYRESAEGILESMHCTTQSSAQATDVDVAVTPKALEIRTSTGGKTYARTLALEGEVVGPEKARRIITAGLKNTGDSVTYRMFSAELGTVIEIRDELAGREDGALKVKQTMSAMPGVSTVWLDGTGWLLRMKMPSPFGEMETVVGPRVGGEAAELPKESFNDTLVRSNVQLKDPRNVERLRVMTRHRQPDLGWPDFTAKNQKVLEQTRDHVLLEIWREAPEDSGRLPFTGAQLERYLRPNALLQSDDAEVRAIASKVAGADRDAWSVARKLQKWTADNMTFDPGIAIVPASEVVRNRKGTCFGYAVLLASLARAAGIPSRLRMGYAYAHGSWGGHAWVDVWTGKQWTPMDSALYAPGAADAARFSFYTSGLEEGTVAGVGELGRLYGHVEIEIVQ